MYHPFGRIRYPAQHKHPFLLAAASHRRNQQPDSATKNKILLWPAVSSLNISLHHAADISRQIRMDKGSALTFKSQLKDTFSSTQLWNGEVNQYRTAYLQLFSRSFYTVNKCSTPSERRVMVTLQQLKNWLNSLPHSCATLPTKYQPPLDAISMTSSRILYPKANNGTQT